MITVMKDDVLDGEPTATIDIVGDLIEITDKFGRFVRLDKWTARSVANVMLGMVTTMKEQSER